MRYEILKAVLDQSNIRARPFSAALSAPAGVILTVRAGLFGGHVLDDDVVLIIPTSLARAIAIAIGATSFDDDE